MKTVLCEPTKKQTISRDALVPHANKKLGLQFVDSPLNMRSPCWLPIWNDEAGANQVMGNTRIK